ncbi:MAG: hypothetical protein R3C05_02580 [Pirellulaceae bacterium]
MNTTQSASDVLDRHFLETRARILEIAAILDRIDRAGGIEGDDRRMQQLYQGIQILLQSDDNRAEQVQRLFSRPYSTNWRQEMGV